MEMLLLFRWTLPAGILIAGGLACLGAHLAARDRAMQTVCVSQGALFGILLALGAMQTLLHADGDEVHALPFVVSLLGGAATFWITERVARASFVSKNTLFAAAFGVLLAGGQFMTAVFPALESHAAQIYFGDLATLTELDGQLTLAFASVLLGLLAWKWRASSNQSFELAVFGEQLRTPSQKRWDLAFNILVLATLCYSVQFLGFLFTIVMLFVPTTILALGQSAGLRAHLMGVVACATLGTGTGFLLSLEFTRLPTVPTASLATLAVALCVKFAALLRLSKY